MVILEKIYCMEGKVSSSKNNDVLDKGEGKNIFYKN